VIQKRLSVIGIVALKELKDFFRDPRSLILSLLLPLILFPLLFWVLTGDQGRSDRDKRIFHIGVEPGFETRQFLYQTERINLSTLEDQVPGEWRNSYDALLVTVPGSKQPVVLYDNSDPISLSAFNYLKEINTSQTSSQAPVLYDSSPVIGQPFFLPEEAAGRMFLGLILPFMFFIFAITCPLPGSADLSSGEKERGSLEPLLSTAAPRSGIILGKLTAASITGICSVGAYLLGIYISYLVIPEILGDTSLCFSISPGQVAVLSLLLFFMTSLFAGIEILAGFMTQSVREAQLLAMPLLMVGMGSVYIAQNIDLGSKSWIYTHLPLVNIALAIREAALGRMITTDILGAFIWCLFYLVLITVLTIGMFQKEFSLVKRGRGKKVKNEYP
jgi:sodium transport system permease protein